MPYAAYFLPIESAYPSATGPLAETGRYFLSVPAAAGWAEFAQESTCGAVVARADKLELRVITKSQHDYLESVGLAGAGAKTLEKVKAGSPGHDFVTTTEERLKVCRHCSARKVYPEEYTTTYYFSYFGDRLETLPVCWPVREEEADREYERLEVIKAHWSNMLRTLEASVQKSTTSAEA